MGAWLETIGVILGALAALVVIVLGIVLILGAFLLLIVIPLGIVITAIVVISKVTRKVKKAAKEFKEAEEEFSVFSDFSYDRVQSFFYAYAADGGCQEIAVVQLKEAGDAAALMNTFKEHLKERHDALAVYQPKQVPLVDHAVIKQKGSQVTMIISEKNGLIQKVFEEQ